MRVDPLVLLDKLCAAGYRVELDFPVPNKGLVRLPKPNLVKAHPESGPLPNDLLRLVKLNRGDLLRALIFAHVEKESRGKPLYGYSSTNDPAPRLPMKRKGWPEDIDRICYESGEFWYEVPTLEVKASR